MASVRTADGGDVEQVVAMARAMRNESPRYRTHPFDSGKVAMVFQRVVATGGAFVAESEGRMVGLMAGFISEDFFGDRKVAGEFALYVTPEARGGSAAVKLVRAFEAWAKAQGAEEVFVGVTAAIDPERAVGLYERLGYGRAGVALVKEI